ncbi:DUF559 domain-containing protein [Mycolicibacter senuensis]|uniref:DUF559 domain-containing protein n=1 Tax=Mycolicibacter senuensis TaxID=386913 RepID=A0A7I9XMB5_9MYCO|nr:DUF559 domain-containing protein [Mycolicibacter senuensis]ORW66337.1 hypothetical protein AWC24_15060 [Mycolicibacter senuensis]GFG71115.1 hypothetical protein MSEN_28350 [Mycolicibacter senuensis]
MGEVFIGSEALAQGRLTEYELRRWHRAICRDVYVPAGHQLTLRDRIEGAWLRSGRKGVIAGVAASALHGARWVDVDIPIELIWSNTRPPAGLIARDETLADDEITKVAGIPVTTPARTAYDLGRHLPRVQAVARMDALARATPFSTEDVLLLAKHHRRARGLRRLRTALPLVDAGAASLEESWLRLRLIDAGLPTPTTQIPVIERGYWPFAWLDMGWERYRVSAEYDGDQHRKDRAQYVRDHRRQRRLEALGWINIRVINEDAPSDVIRRVTAAMRSRGWHP